MNSTRARHRLKPHVPEVLSFVFQRLAEECRAHGIPAAAVYRPESGGFPYLVGGKKEQLLERIRAAGLPILDLSDAYASVTDRGSLMVVRARSYDFLKLAREAADDHPNELAHQLLADELYRLLHTEEGKPLLTPKVRPAKQ
jgi:hypothetical protein